MQHLGPETTQLGLSWTRLE